MYGIRSKPDVCLLRIGRFLLVRHPHCLERLKAEIKDTVGMRTDLSRSDLKRIKYLDNVLNESECILNTRSRTNSFSIAAVSFRAR